MAHEGRVPPDYGNLRFRVYRKVPDDINSKVVAKKRDTVSDTADRLADNPYPPIKNPFNRKMKNGVVLRRAYAARDYRIFYTVHEGEIRVLGVRPKDKNTYKNLEDFGTRYDEMDQEE